MAARARGELNFVWIAFDHRGAEARVKDRGETRDAMRARGMMTDDFVRTSRARARTLFVAQYEEVNQRPETDPAG